MQTESPEALPASGSAGERRPTAPGELRLIAWAELAGVWALAFAHNAFGRVASGPEAFTSVGADRLDLVLLIALLALFPPTLAWLIELGIAKLGREREAAWFHATCIGFAAAVFVVQIAIDKSSKGLVLVAFLVAVPTIFAYLRLEPIRQLVRVLTVSTPIVIVLFLASYPTIDLIKPAKSPASVAEAARSDHPVVLIVFDEFSLDYLLDEDGEIDRALFPNFHRLAQHSTWYPNAKSKSSQTLLAIPSIMTGMTPTQVAGDSPKLTPPSASAYPDNLCHVLKGAGFTTHTFETITDFCGSSYPRITRLLTLASRGTMPPHVPKGHILDRINNAVLGLAPPYRSDFQESRSPVIRDFIAGIPDSPRTFNFLHSLLPHTEWMYVPDGHYYPPDLVTPNPWARSPEARDAAFQQIMLQTGFVDGQIGALMDALEEKGIWKDALVIVTADHGLNLEYGGERRALDEKNAGALLPIPLFVKYPDQESGTRVNKEVASIDIFPTILDVLGIESDTETDGKSLLNLGNREPGDEIAAQGYHGPIEVSRRDFEDQRDKSQRMRQRLFGGGSFYAVGGFPDLLGVTATESSDFKHLPSDLDGRTVNFDTTAEEVPLRWEVSLKEAPSNNAASVALAVNGVVAATSKAWLDQDTGAWKVSVVLPYSAFRQGANELATYEITLRAPR